jgi:transcriptional regulator with XRE-family HTH domain
MMTSVGTRERPIDRAVRAAQGDFTRVLRDVRLARRGSGLSQRSVAVACGLEASRVSRLERGLVMRPDLAAIYCLADVVGLKVSTRAFPAGDPLRDAGHLRLLERLRARLATGIQWRTEVPLPNPGDRRCWDAAISGAGWHVNVEAETVIDDVQALQRRMAIKVRDGQAETLLLLVADTRRNRQALLAARATFTALPFDTREILTALGEGRHPPGSGMVVL